NLEVLHETPESILRDFEPDSKKVEGIIKKAGEEKRLILTFDEAKEILLAYGIPVITTSKAHTEEEAVITSESLGFPVVLKIDSEKIFHKMEKGAVILNLRDQSSVVEAFRRLKEIAISCGDPKANVLVQPMIVRHGFELVIGAKKDLTFGSVMVFGTGGELLEAVEDYSIGLPPLNQTLARRMMAETKIYKYLKTLEPYSQTLRALEETLVRFSQLIIDFPQIKEIDINPFFVTEKECFALDIVILLEAEVLEGFRNYREEYCPPHLSICPYPVRYMHEFQLANGITVHIRPIRPEDEPLLEELFRTSSEQTMVMRFLQIPKKNHEQLVRYCHIDYDREMAFVAVVKENEREKIIGDVRFSRQPDIENAEMAVVVADRWQGMGIGKRLCDYCVGVAQQSGVKRLWMEISINNPRMINLSEGLDFKKVYSDADMIKVMREL
ncbi:MAG: GNAT family N-acetyltransferase, partial [Nitrospira sp.]|nr:GNAT family N-acetyltransferase [Nitrospira sp.]